MRYENIVPGVYLKRPNRFIAHIEISGKEEICHVKNTGRCRELLPAGAKVFCQHFDSPTRKTSYDLITVEKGQRLINMDSQAPNKAAKEWLEKGGKQCFLEVKGVTLETDGVCAFPDAPTQRGAKHLQELTRLCQEGYGAYVLFVIQMADVKYLHPNDATDPAFGKALREAAAAGVQVLAVNCCVTENTMEIRNPVEIKLDLPTEPPA